MSTEKKQKNQKQAERIIPAKQKQTWVGPWVSQAAKHLVPFSKECDQTVTLWQFRDAEAS